MVRIKYFFEGLKTQGFEEGKNLEAEIIDSNDLSFLEAALSKKRVFPVELIHAVGTPNAALAAQFTSRIPVVYYGAHPEGVGAEECQQNNSCGVILNLPFTAHYKNFRFIKQLIPGLENIYVPFYEKTIFCHAAMKSRYRIYKKQHPHCWVPMDSEYIGYKSIAGLSYIIGIRYYEFLYADLDELHRILDQVSPVNTLLMPYNDNFYCKSAPELLLEFSYRKEIPLLWNNNPEATQFGALAAIAGCFKQSGIISGEMAGRILKGASAAAEGYRDSTKSYSSINLKLAQSLGLQLSEVVLDKFDEVIGAS